MNSHGLRDGLMNDYCDGEFFKRNPIFQEDPCALQIQLYYDELELCNPLGSKVKKHKLGKQLMIVCILIIILVMSNLPEV